MIEDSAEDVVIDETAENNAKELEEAKQLH